VSGRTKNDGRLALLQLAGRSQEDTVSLVQLRPTDLTPKNRELVTKHHDLELLELARSETQRNHRERTPKEQVQQRYDQADASLTRIRRSGLYGRVRDADAPSRARRDYVPHAHRSLAQRPPLARPVG
jgi:hypothetical protein